MPEAEDVLLEAAEYATHTVRSAWQRRRGAPGRGEAPPTREAQRRLLVWQTAWLGRSWPTLGFEPAPPPGRLARRLRRLPPWAGALGAFTDGRRIWLPHAWMEEARPHAAADRALAATLGLAWRLARGAGPARPAATALARDVAWLAEGALAVRALALAWPGLVGALDSLRREALARRPAPEDLTEVEREVERWLQTLLAHPPHGSRTLDPLGGLGPDAEASEIDAFARDLAGRLDGGASGYRGVAPVPHWGMLRAGIAEGGAAQPRKAQAGAPRPSRGARLPRPLRRRAPDPDAEERPGPFVLPFADPHLTVDEPGGWVPPPDRGHDEDLETLAEELARLEELPTVRHEGAVREVLEDGGGMPSPPTPAGSREATHGPVWLYPEWDAGRGAYREPGCCVREVAAGTSDGGWAESTLAARRELLARLRRQLESLRPRRERLRRQPDGDDLDLVGWVDDWADARAERAPAGRVYTRERTRRRDVAVTLLLDVSGSTESWLSGSQRVIDVVKEAALAFGEALATVGDRFALHAFSGEGAGDVRIRVLKRFGEAPGPEVRRRIGALEPDAFTRLGGALRHATAGLARERARARLLVVLSDGKPQDEDGYEGRYAIEDVRQAVAEARLQGVRVFGVTVDREGPDYLPRLFGPHSYTVIWNAEALPERLPALYRRLTAGS